MKKIWITIALTAALVGCGSKSNSASTGGDTPAGGGDSKPAVAKNPWGSFKVGSYETTKTSTTAAGNTMATEIKMTLVALTADKATVETATTVMGNTTKANVDIPLTATQTPNTPPNGTAPNATVKSGNETLTIAGKSLACKWTETEADSNGNHVTSKIWMSEEVPGFVVKMVSKTTGSATMEMSSEVTDYKVM